MAELGHFGHLPYGHTFKGKLHYPVTKKDACKKFSKEDFKNDTPFDEEGDMQPILLIDNGGDCSHM